MGLSWLFGGEKILYYPGCLTKGVLKNEFENYKEIFNKLGVNFVLLTDKESCCGLPVMNAGYKKDARKIAMKNYKIFKERGITKIVTNCPSCYNMFNDIYPKVIRGWDIKTEHATLTILGTIIKKKIRYKGSDEDRENVTYHDPCYLGRYSGIYEEPRKVINLLGGKIIELAHNRENSICCGGGGGIRSNFPQLAKSIAKKKAESIPEKANKIISPCGLCYTNIKSESDKSIEFSSFVLGRLRSLR